MGKSRELVDHSRNAYPEMKKIVVLVLFFSLVSCKTSSAYRPLFYRLEDFNSAAGKEFIERIKPLHSIQKISIIDRNVERNEFRVNNVNIFNDTLQANRPNNYSYSKYASENGINKAQLNEVLNVFNAMKVSEFIRKDDFYLFPVEKYALAKQKGYLYVLTGRMKVNDTLFREGAYGNIILKRRVDENWFEYESEE